MYNERLLDLHGLLDFFIGGDDAVSSDAVVVLLRLVATGMLMRGWWPTISVLYPGIVVEREFSVHARRYW